MSDAEIHEFVRQRILRDYRAIGTRDETPEERARARRLCDLYDLTMAAETARPLQGRR